MRPAKWLARTPAALLPKFWIYVLSPVPDVFSSALLKVHWVWSPCHASLEIRPTIFRW
jgi:hypothetical protein